jgi:2-amino-4-hydroxy-6-hydroxymethyldihydropteridine diphosphokinase
MINCYLGIGSNLGNRRKNIREALEIIKNTPGLQVKKVSRIYETNPVGGPRQPKFLNGAIRIKTSFAALDLLKVVKAIEKKMGRVRSVKNGPRIIDLDILLYGNRSIKRKGLIVPHPRMREREFVLKPLSELTKINGIGCL